MLPCFCPSCKAELKVRSLKCEQCSTEVLGLYRIPPMLLLSAEEQDFVLKFIKCSGSLKEMAVQLNLSYPSVRNLLNDIIEKVEKYEN